MKRFTLLLFVFLLFSCACFTYNSYIITKPIAKLPNTASSAVASSAVASSNEPPGTITFVNNTGQTIWVGAQHNPDATFLPDGGGWRLDQGQTHSVTLPNGWAGKFWGRTGCTFDSSGSGSCATGDCGNHLQCNGDGSADPISLAEFKFNGYQGDDFYDVSYVAGYNLPIIITVASPHPHSQDPYRCGDAGCPTDVNATCPSELQKKDTGGKVIGCMSPCDAFNHMDIYCCEGAYRSAQTCDPTKWPVNYAQVFKKACPSAYSYPFDDPTSTFACRDCSYQVAFGSLGSS